MRKDCVTIKLEMRPYLADEADLTIVTKMNSYTQDARRNKK